MMKHSSWAVAAVGLALALAPAPAAADIRVTLTSDATTQVVTQNGNLFAGFFTDLFGLGSGLPGYLIEITSALTNFGQPGQTSGTLTTTALFSTNSSGPIPNLTVTAEVVDGPGPLANLANFTTPMGNALFVNTNITGAGGGAASGTVIGTTFVNGTPVAVGPVSIPGIVETEAGGTVSGPTGYTLANQLIISGVNPGATSTSVTVASTVAVPEPSSFVLTGLVAIGLVGVGYRRRLQARMGRMNPLPDRIDTP